MMTQTPPDMQSVVERNRGLLKKIELAIPGFRGYRKLEDLRIADNLLRIYIADRLSRICMEIEEVKGVVSKKLDLNLVSMVGEAENAIRIVEKRLRHAEQGYSGLVPDYKISEDELLNLYSYDEKLLETITELEENVSSLQGKAVVWSPEDMEKVLSLILENGKSLSRLLDERRNCMLVSSGVNP